MEAKKTAAERWLDRVQGGELDPTIKLQTKRLRDALVEVAVTEMAEDFADLPDEIREQLPVAREAIEALIAGIAEYEKARKVKPKPVAEPAPDLDGLAVRELRQMATTAGVVGGSKMKKDELVAALAGLA
jgi:hypothetical protein